MGRYDHIDFKPPKDAIAAYKNGLKRHEDGETGDGMEPITIRMAQAFARGEPCTPEWARKGNRWWGRNARFAEAEPGTPAYAAAQLWGGRNWFASVVRQMDAADAEASGKRDDMKKKETKAFSLPGVKIVDGDQGIVEHVVTIFGVLDAVNDIAHPGSWTKTISERGQDFLVLDMHGTDSTSRILGKPVRIWEVKRDGLPQKVKEKYPEATGGVLAHTQFLLDTPEGKGAFARIKAGALREWSYGYDPLDVDYTTVLTKDGKEITARNLRTLKVYEYGPVLWGAVPGTTVMDVKSENEPAEAKPAPDVTENTIRIRVHDPDDFQEDSIRTINIGSEDNGISATAGRLHGETVMRVQAYVFDRDKWEVEDAQEWVDEHKKSGGLETDEKQMTEEGDAGALVPAEFGSAPYKYECTKCGYKMEGNEFLGAEAKCPKCGAMMQMVYSEDRLGYDVSVKAITDEDKRVIRSELGEMNLRDVVATHRRLHQMASRGATLTGFTRADMNWFNTAVEDELVKRAEEENREPPERTPLEWGEKADEEDFLLLEDDEEKHLPSRIGRIAAREREKARRLLVRGEAVNLSQMVEDIRVSFTTQYNSPSQYNYWVTDIYVGYVIVSYEGDEGRQHFKVGYSIDPEGKFVFAPRAEWIEGGYIFVPLESGMKAGRVLADRNVQRIVGALMTLIDVLEDAGVDVPGYDRTQAVEPSETTEKSRYILVAPEMSQVALARLSDNLNKWSETERPFFVLDNLPDGQQIKLLEVGKAPALQVALDNSNDGKATTAGARSVGQPPTSEDSQEIELLELEMELSLLEV